jgi:hypothetical protein
MILNKVCLQCNSSNNNTNNNIYEFSKLLLVHGIDLLNSSVAVVDGDVVVIEWLSYSFSSMFIIDVAT